MPEKPNQLIDPEVQPHDDGSGNNGVGVSSQPLSVPHQLQQPPYGQQPSSQPQWGQQPPQQWQQPLPLQQYTQYSQQQGYGQPPMQPGMYPPPPPPKKRSKLWLWITLGVVAVLLIGCVAAAAAATNAAKNAVNTNISPLNTAIATTSTNNTPQTTGQVAKVGQTITLQNIAATFISVKKLPDDQYNPASPGNMYIVVHVKLVNNSSGEVDYNVFDFHVKSGSGNITTETFTSSYTANNQLNSGKLSPGGSVEGDIVFQTGKSDHNAQLTWQPSFFGNAGDNGWLLGL